MIYRWGGKVHKNGNQSLERIIKMFQQWKILRLAFLYKKKELELTARLQLYLKLIINVAFTLINRNNNSLL